LPLIIWSSLVAVLVVAVTVLAVALEVCFPEISQLLRIRQLP
jgi:hypothetical protein